MVSEYAEFFISKHKVSYCPVERNSNCTIMIVAPSIIQNPLHITQTDGRVKFEWDEPFGRGDDKIIYVVKYGDTTQVQERRTFTIETELLERTYTVQVNLLILSI